MKTIALLVAVSAGAFAQDAGPSVTNARFESRAFSGDLAAQIRAGSATWFGYAVRTIPHEGPNCDYPSTVHLEAPPTVDVVFRVENNTVQKVEVYSTDCSFDAGGLPFIWITSVPAKASLAYLQTLVSASGADRALDSAVLAISVHDALQADAILEQLARPPSAQRIREKAIFWLAQKAGERAAAAIVDAIENDPDTEVKKKAVFALSQLPKDQAIPKLIEIASKQRNREVRKQAFFWLGQSGDPRALAFIEQTLLR
jgi:HEAT repeats